MQSLWDDSLATPFANSPLALRVYTSRLLGGNPSLVLHGGGNTSVKTHVPDLFGEREEILYVKGSGWDLATIEAAGFAPVRMKTLLRMAELEHLSDGDMVKHQRAAMIDPGAPTPSVEAILHAIIPFQFVDHSHADAVVIITNTEDGAERIRNLYGLNMLIVPYVMPGFILARTVYQMTRTIDWQRLDGMVLLNHGLFTWGDDARTSYERHIDIVTRAEEYLVAHAAVEIHTPQRAAEKRPALAHLRQSVSYASGAPMLAQLDASESAVAFSTLPNVADLSTRGLLTPDHVIRTKRIPTVIEDDPAAAIAQYVDDYHAYFARNTDGTLTELDPAPRWAVWPGHGTVAFGRTMQEMAIINDIVRHTIAAIHLAEALGGWHVLGEKEIFEIEYWELEQAKLKRGSRPPELAGKVALVTGAASGIGRACVEALVKRGAAVAALDINPAIANQFTSSQVLGVVCDVSNEDAMQNAIDATVRHFGGLDMIVSNAGVFTSSQTIADMGADSWERSLSLNLTSHQRLLQRAIPYLKLGFDPAVVIIASKNVPAPGPGAGAYSVAKAGLTQLARVAALELGKFGIRVNVLHPNAVFDTGIWTPEVLAQRAQSYGLTVDEYKRNNVLGVEVTSQDVAALACALLGPTFAKTTGAQIPVDGGNERVI